MDKEGEEGTLDEESKEIVTTPAKKRKVTSCEKIQPAKRRRGNQLIRKYISCKRWQEEDRRNQQDESQGESTTSPEEGPTTPPSTTPVPPTRRTLPGESCITSMQEWMPDSIVQASSGGIAPGEPSTYHKTDFDNPKREPGDRMPRDSQERECQGQVQIEESQDQGHHLHHQGDEEPG